MSEPERYEAIIEYCSRDWFGREQCPDCTGHAAKQETAEWKAWDAERQRADEPKPRKKYKYRYPTDEEKCRATSAATGERCNRYAWKSDSDGFCGQHARMTTRALLGEFDQHAENLRALSESLKAPQ